MCPPGFPVLRTSGISRGLQECPKPAMRAAAHLQCQGPWLPERRQPQASRAAPSTLSPTRPTEGPEGLPASVRGELLQPGAVDCAPTSIFGNRMAVKTRVGDCACNAPYGLPFWGEHLPVQGNCRGNRIPGIQPAQMRQNSVRAGPALASKPRGTAFPGRCHRAGEMRSACGAGTSLRSPWRAEGACSWRAPDAKPLEEAVSPGLWCAGDARNLRRVFRRCPSLQNAPSRTKERASLLTTRAAGGQIIGASRCLGSSVGRAADS